MTEHIIVVRVRSDETFVPTRAALRAAILRGAEAWGGNFKLVSVSPVPKDRYIKRRKSPTRPQFPLVDLMEGR